MNETNAEETNTENDSPALPGKLPHPARRRIGMKVLLSLVIFASGAIVGTCTTLLLIRQQVLNRIHHPEEMPAKVASRLQWKLDLSDDQTQQIESILIDRQQAIQQIRREFQPKLELQLDQMETQVAGVLNESQRTTWQDWFQEIRAKWLPAAP